MQNFDSTRHTQKVLLLGVEADSLINFRSALIRHLVRLGHDVHVAAIKTTTEQRSILVELGAQFHAVPFSRAGMNPLRDIATFVSLFLMFRQLKPDVVVSYTSKPVIYGSLAASFAGIPRRVAMITGLGYSFVDGREGARRLARLISRMLYGFALPGCAAVIFQNPDDRDEFQRLGLLNAGQNIAVVNGSGVDTTYFSAVPLPPKMVFLMVARLLGDKGFREFAAAAQLVLQQEPDTVFQILGATDPSPNAIGAEELQSWQQRGIAYLGEKKDVRPVIAGASVVVLPSYREGTPRSVLEGMAMGRAVITTDVPGCRETVVHGHNGLLVAVRDIEALADAMLQLARDPARVSVMGQASRRIAVSKYDAEVVAADTALKAGFSEGVSD